MSIVEELGGQITSAGGQIKEAQEAALVAIDKLNEALGRLQAVRGELTEASAGASQLNQAIVSTNQGLEHTGGAVESMGTAAGQLNTYLGILGLGDRIGSEPHTNPKPTPADKTESTRSEHQLLGRPLTEEEVRSDRERFDRGEPVNANPEHIGNTPPLTQEELDELKRDEPLFNTWSPEELERMLPPEQWAIIQRKLDEFLARINADRKRSGLTSPIVSISIGLGYYDPREDDELASNNNLHVDPRPLPTVRYVESVTGPSTVFGAGTTRNTDLNSRNELYHPERVNPAGQWQPIDHGPGAISRFRSDFVPHKSPDDPGFRLFFSADVPVGPPNL